MLLENKNIAISKIKNEMRTDIVSITPDQKREDLIFVLLKSGEKREYYLNTDGTIVGCIIYGPHFGC